MLRTRALTLAALLGVALPTVVAVAPATARPIERGEFHFDDSGVIKDLCDVPGFDVLFDVVVDGRFSVKSHGPDGLLFYAEHSSFTQTLTNPANDLSVFDRTHVTDKDLRIVDNGDGTLTIQFLITGPSTLYGPNGKAIARNPGQVRFQVVVDHGGTPTDPSDDVELSFEQIKGSTGRSDDYCAAIIDTIR